MSKEPVLAISEIRKDIESRGGVIGSIESYQGWVFLRGEFNAKQLKRLAKEIEKVFIDRSK